MTKAMGTDRRTVLKLTGAAALAASLPPALAGKAGAAGLAPQGPQHGLSVFGAPQLPADFTHFPYVNPDAPKGGSMRLLASAWQTNQNPTTFNTFNMFILRGDSPPFMELTNASLMVRNWQEPDAVYGLLAETVTIEGQDHIFALRPGATFSDGSPITAADVVYSFNILKSDGHPSYRNILAGVENVSAPDPRTAVVTFAEGTSNRLPPLVSLLPILSEAYWTERGINTANMDVPVTSGAYVVGDFRPGRFASFRRREDDWMANIPARVGHHNFDEVRVDFFRERLAGFEAFKIGDVTFREEFTSKTWATEYNFPAIQDGRVIKTSMPDGRPAGAQGMFFNTRLDKFKDPRTREAIGMAFDFEWMNENLFYGLYERTYSYFMNSDMVAEGAPSPEELALLEPFRGEVPEEVFGEAWTPVVTDGSGRDRAPLRRSVELLRAAGWERRDGGLFNAAGEQLTLEFLYAQPTWERVLQPYANRLGLLGIPVSLRMVESAQYQSRLNTFDFEMTTRRYAFAPTPGESIREFWTSQSAAIDGSFNIAGIANPAIDALTETLINAPSRDEMVVAARALDRVLRAGHYWVPQWYNKQHNIAYWDRFGIPEMKPKYFFPVETTWWSKA